jgi:hypothetical protein
MTLLQVLDWIETLEVGEHFHVGKLDAKEEKSIGVYQRDANGEPRKCIGSTESYEIKKISVLVHWNMDSDETETNALVLFNKIKDARNVTIGTSRVNIIKMMVSEPQDVGTDDNGIYERVIWFDLLYEL